MRRLLLMRHAKSDWSFAGRSDHDRPLNARGRTSAAAVGDWMRTEGHLPDEVLCSSAQRTRETLNGLRLGATRVNFSRALYHAEPEPMRDVLRAASGSVVLMIGHNPGICSFARRLTLNPPQHHRFEDYPTGATLVCDFAIASWRELDWRSGETVDFVVPRALSN